MQQLPIGPALAYVRTSAGKSQSQIGVRFAVSNIEHGKADPMCNTMLRMLHKAGARLIIVTRAGEQIEVMREDKP